MTADAGRLGIRHRLARGVRVQALYNRGALNECIFVMRMIRITENDEALGQVTNAPFNVPFRIGDEVQVPMDSIERVLGV